MAEDDSKTVRLVSQEGESFDVPVGVARMSELVKSMIDEGGQDDDEAQEIPLPNVKAQTLARVIEFCQHFKAERMNEIEKPLKSANMSEIVQEWYATYVSVEQDVLFELILAANFMDIKPLLDLTCASVASMIKGKTPEEIRKTFNIVNDFTPEEEAQVREENKWCEEA
ncbi:unnamed protein product [Ectocarpus fasciculatus]